MRRVCCALSGPIPNLSANNLQTWGCKGYPQWDTTGTNLIQVNEQMVSLFP
jgi:hypothetical protein